MHSLDSRDTSDAPYIEAITRVVRGDPSAFRPIITDFQDEIMKIALAYLRDPEEAEDAVQEIFLRAYRALHRFQLEKPFRPWLFTIATNYLKNSYRNRKRKRAFEEKLPENPLQSRHTAEKEAENGMDKLLIREVISTLPPRLKEAVILYYVEDLDIKTIARALNIGEENVKSRLFRARKKLRKNPAVRNHFYNTG